MTATSRSDGETPFDPLDNHLDSGAKTRLTAVVVWHGILAAISAFGFVAAVGPSSEDLPAPIRWIIVIGATVGVVANVAVIPWLRKRIDRGRTLSIAVNYLTFVVAASALLGELGVFVGLDDFADGFEHGIWFLLIPLLGWGIMTLGRRYIVGGMQEQTLNVGRGVIGVGLLVFLLKVGLLRALAHMGGELIRPKSLLWLLVAVATVAAIVELWRARTRTVFGTSRQRQEQIEGFLFLSPNLLGFMLFFAGPLVFSFVISFWDWDALGEKNFVGFSNYIDLFSLDLAFMDGDGEPSSNALKSGYSELWRFNFFGSNIMLSAVDKMFWQSMRNIIMFMILAVPSSVIPALLLSNLLNSKLPGVKLFRSVFFIPSIAGVIGISLIWRQLFNTTVGWLNYLLTEALPGDIQISWLSDQDTALLAIGIVFAWMTFGFNTVLFLAGLQGIPNDLMEAAQLDGATTWERFRYITVPLLRPTTFFVVTMTMIQATQLFDIVFVLMVPPEGPNNSTLTPVLYLYQQGFQQFSQGYASAVAWVLFILIFGLTLLQFRRNQAAEEGMAL